METSESQGKPPMTTVVALRPDTTGHNLLVKIIDVKTAIDRVPRPGAKPQKVIECLVGDETGSIIFSARNDHADSMKPGNYVEMRNAKVDMRRGTMRLVLDQFGKIKQSNGMFEPKLDLNMSWVEYELVPVPNSVKASLPTLVAEESENGS